MQEQPTYLSQRVSNVNIDMSFLKQLTHQPPIETASLEINRVNNIDNLAQLLKLKNIKYSFNQQTKETGLEWVKKKGGNLNPLMEKIKVIKQQVKNKEEERKSQSQCYFYMPKVTFENKDQYIEKNFQFGVFSTLQSIMSEGKSKGNLAKRILNKRKINRQNNQQSHLDSLPTINLQIRNPRKKQEYLKATKQILSIENNMKGTEWATIYRATTKQQFWQIMNGQISDKTHKSISISSLAAASLKMVQAEFNSIMPSNYESILYYLTNNYLGKMRGQYESEGTLGPIWGISYMLYRAGRKEQFYRILPDQELKKLFQQADASILEGKPKKYGGVQENGDLFHDQLIYALKGFSKCSTEALCDPNNLDITWVFLRNVGIFPQETNTFLSLRKQLYQSYKGPFISEQKIKNLLYLLGYGDIAQIGINDIMDQDDFLHFLIAIYHSPAFEIAIKDKRQIVQRRLTEQLIQYIQELLLEHKDEYIYYMIVIPHNKIVEEVSSIIASSQLLQTINWKYLAQKLSYNLYEKLVQVTLQKYADLHQDYVQVAKKQYELLNNKEVALNFILQMFIKSVLSLKINSEELRKGELFANDLIAKDQKLKRDYTPVFNFFEQYRRLLLLIQQRNESKIYAFLRQSKHILISEQLRMDTRIALEKLIELKGFQCYIYFVKNMIKAYEIALTRMGRIDDLQQLQSLTLSALVGLMHTQPYSQYANRESVKDLHKILEEALPSYD